MNVNERALVVVFLRGGADTLNLLVPHGEDAYYRHRPTLGLRPEAGLHRLTDFFSLHPKMAPLIPSWREGRLAFVQAVGTDNPTGSHFEAQDQVEQGGSFAQPLSGGWLGRLLRELEAGQAPLSAIAVGDGLPKSLRGAPAAVNFRTLDELELPRSAAGAGDYAHALAALYEPEPGILGLRARDTLATLRQLGTLRHTRLATRSSAAYPDSTFGRSLAEVARLIKARVGVRVACVDLANWDTHFFQGGVDGLQAGLIDQLSRGLAAFSDDLSERREDVLVLTVTEFGRRLYENGSGGTDHGRGFAAMLTGAGLNGGVHGQWPGFEQDDAPGPGGLSVGIDFRHLWHEVAQRWLAVPNAARLFPDLVPQPTGALRSS